VAGQQQRGCLTELVFGFLRLVRSLGLYALVGTVVIVAIWFLSDILHARFYSDSPHAAEMTLRDAQVAAIMWSEGSTDRPPGFLGFTAETAATIKPLTWNTSSTAVSGEVSIRVVTETSIVLVTMAPKEPRCVALTMSGDGPPRVTYGVTDAHSVADCDDSSW